MAIRRSLAITFKNKAVRVKSMLGHNNTPNTTFERATTIAPTEAPQPSVEGVLTSTPEAPQQAVPPTMTQPLATPITTNQKAQIGTAKQPNTFFEVALVTGQFVALFGVAVAFFPSLLWQNTALQIVGSLLVAAGIALGIWAALSFRQRIRILPSPSNTSLLVTSGPFRYVRHPMYSALLIASSGLFIAYPTLPRLGAVILLVIVLLVKTRYEEQLLAQRFSGYDTYALHTGRLLPKLHRRAKAVSNDISIDSDA
jgi:protein-S-isoprenylcysteine O-methyltransferase Ste14